MSVDMGESLIFSYLKHIKNCRIVQSNWKVFEHWRENTTNEGLFEDLRDTINFEIDESIFGTDSASKIFKQAECDVIGIAYDEKGNEVVHAVDIAYHRDGLGYGSEKVNAIKVVQKCVRTAMCIYNYFNCSVAEIIFATPKIKGNQDKLIKEYLAIAEKIVKEKLNPNYSLKLIYGNAFENEILNNVKNLYNTVNDTGEYFLRCYQLEQMFKGKVVNIIPEDICQEANEESETEIKVGWIANNDLRGVLEKLTDISKVENLMNPEYCNEVFYTNKKYPILCRDRNADNSARYYSKPVKIMGCDYYICNDWYERNRMPLLKWINENI